MKHFKITFEYLKNMKRSLRIVTSLLAVVSIQLAVNAQDGEAIFNDNCTTCHAMDSKVIGPALKGVTERRSEDWIKSFIKNSSAMIAAEDPTAVKLFEENGKTQMTTFDGTLTEEEIASVITYLKDWTPPAAAAPVPGGGGTVVVAPPVDPFASTKFTILLFVLIIPITLFIVALTMTLYKFLNVARKEAGMEGSVLSGTVTDEVIEDHSYDGIQELNNSMPPWLTAIFGLTAAFAVIYMTYYFVFDGPTQDEEYQAQIAEATALYGDMDVVTVRIEMVEDAGKIAGAKEIFNSNCKNCHREDGGGGIGPNLTDDYWKNGGSLEDVFNTIREGVPGKPMVAWKSKLSDEDILNVASYIKTMYGTNPPDAKEKEGELYKPEK